MKLNSKLKIISIMVVLLMVGLAGCGKNKQAAKAHNKPQEISVYKDNRVWFEAGWNQEKISGNTPVKRVSIIRNGKIKTYETLAAANSGNKKLIMKNFVNLTQSEILKEAAKADAQHANNYKGENKEYIPTFFNLNPTVKIEGKKVIAESFANGSLNLTMSNQTGVVNNKRFVGYRDFDGNGFWTLTNNKNSKTIFDSLKDKGVTQEHE